MSILGVLRLGFGRYGGPGLGFSPFGGSMTGFWPFWGSWAWIQGSWAWNLSILVILTIFRVLTLDLVYFEGSGPGNFGDPRPGFGQSGAWIWVILGVLDLDLGQSRGGPRPKIWSLS